jgi:RNA polymerase sigma-70 factor (ECF subfamily)
VGAEAAEDAAQEALVRAWRHRAACGNPRAPEAWVRSISRREALRIVGRPRHLELVGEEREDRASAAPAPSAVDVRRAVGVLGEIDRRLVLRFYWAGQADHEIARDLGMPVGTVKVRLHRARMRLHDELGEGFWRAD